MDNKEPVGKKQDQNDLLASASLLEGLFTEDDFIEAASILEKVCDCCGMSAENCESFRLKEEIASIENKIHKLHFDTNSDAPKKTEAEIVSDASAELFGIVEKKKIKTVSNKAAKEIDELSKTRSEKYALLEKSWNSCEPSRVNWKRIAILMQLKLLRIVSK